MAEKKISNSMVKTENEKEMEKVNEKNEEKKPEESIVNKKENKFQGKTKKNEAIVNGRNLNVGIKHAVAICNMIRGKNIDKAIEMLEEVTKLKRAVPMKGEIPHRKGIMSGRYPAKASRVYLKLLKSLKSNAIHQELELENFKIFIMPNVASRPYKRFGAGRFKRSHVLIKLIPISASKNKKI